MIVCEVGERWQIVMQTDHADLSGDFARRWTERTDRSGSLEVAAERHDDGWAVWEQAPTCDVHSGKPLNFLDVGVLAHLAFYRAGIAAITEQDPYAGLLVSMHGAGIYQGRYGLQPELRLTFAGEVREQVDAFVAEQEGTFEAREREAGVTEQERRNDYELLQIYDRLSLLFCMNDTLAPPAGELGGYRFEPDGDGAITMTPFPFDGAEQQFSLVRRLVARGEWSNPDAFRRDLFATRPEATSITIRAAGG
jgi:Protein of unknown function (DUF3891)